MKTWSKGHSIPQGLTEQPNKMSEQSIKKKDWKKDEEKKILQIETGISTQHNIYYTISELQSIFDWQNICVKLQV